MIKATGNTTQVIEINELCHISDQTHRTLKINSIEEIVEYHRISP